MINEENLNKMYEGIIDGSELTTKVLNSYGFNSKDLADLIELGNLERIKRGYYSFLSVNDLFYYGKKLIAKKEYDKATKCFERCYELDPSHSGVCFQLFLRSISNKDYESAFKYFDVLSNTDNPYYNADSNFYLYLLSIITEVPDKHREYSRYLKFEDIKVSYDDKRYQDISLQNKMRYAALQRKFPYALKQLKDLTQKHGTSTVQEMLIKKLLFQASEVEMASKKKVLELVKTKNYEEVISYLEDKQLRHNLSMLEGYILKLTNEIISIKKTMRVRQKEIFETNNLFDAIDGYNYQLALELSIEYYKKNNMNSDNTINVLLSDLCELIKNILSAKTNQVGNTNVVEVVEVTKQQSSQPFVDDEGTSKATFSGILECLMNQELENAFNTLRNYLNLIGKIDYEFLIIDLIKLSLIEGDIAFYKPMIALTYISREDFTFDISSYIQNFYITLSQNKFDEARIYLDIISKSNKLGQSCILTDNLLQVLETTEKMLDFKRNNFVLDEVEEALEGSRKIKDMKTQVSVQKIVPLEERVEKEEITITIPQSKTSTIDTVVKTSTFESRDADIEFIRTKYDELLKGRGMVLLKPMNSDRIKKLQKIVDGYSDMVSFVIGEGSNIQLVLRYRPKLDGYVDVKNLISAGNIAYAKGDYATCINDYLQLLQFGEPKAFVYAKLGLAYMKLHNKDLAVEYLTIATEKSKVEKSGLDFTEIVANLSGMLPQYDKKPRVKMKLQDFTNSVNYYGIENFDEIVTYITDTGLDVESACINLGLDDEQICVVMLIYAREYYSQGSYDKGDQFLKVVERSKNKTKLIVEILEEIRKNKKFYINRASENRTKLVLTLQPKK